MTTCFYLHGMPDIRHTPECVDFIAIPKNVMRVEPIINPEGFATRISVTFKGSMDEDRSKAFTSLSKAFARSGYHQEKPPEPEEDEKDGS